MCPLMAAATLAAAIAIAPTDAELALARWQADCWLGRGTGPPDASGVGLDVRQQTFGTLRMGRNAFGRPIKLGGREYAHGLGTHSTSEIVVTLPGPGEAFEALVGLDENGDSQGRLGSVSFKVHVDGETAASTGVRIAPCEPVPLSAPLGGALTFALFVGDAGDGPAHDQASWADARVVLQDGAVVYLDDLPILRPPSRLQPAPPFSWQCGGRPGVVDWQAHDLGDRRWLLTGVDLTTGLRAQASLRIYDDFPALEWTLELTNDGDLASPPVSDLLALDLTIDIPPGELATLHHARGSTCEIADFMPLKDPLKPGDTLRLAPVGGRSSNGVLPFMNLELGTAGLMVAIGWSGQWYFEAERPEQGRLRLHAGQETLRTVLEPGETIRSPKMLVLPYHGGDPLRGNNLFRRLMVEHIMPRVEGKLVFPPIAHPTSWALLSSGQTGNMTNQFEMLEAAAAIGAEVFWLDAYWFPGGFPTGVGNWRHRSEDFPEGLRPLADAVHARGMEFCLWFEPERVSRTSELYRESPQYCLDLGNGGDLLYDLGSPEACEAMTTRLLGLAAEYDVDIYREDFNFDPLQYLAAADPPERQGMAEMRFVEGLYAMWDALLASDQVKWIDNCASGGRRIDLETMARSLPLWRSDFQDIGVLHQPHPLGTAAIASQVQNVGLGLYVPLSSNGLYAFDPYSVRSATCGGLNPYIDLRPDTYDRDEARAALAEVRELRPYFIGDLYPLTSVTTSPADWCAYQLDRPEHGDGIALIFRRHHSAYAAMDLALRGIDAQAMYEWSLSTGYEPARPQLGRGEELQSMRVTIDEKPGSVLLRYRKAL